MPGVASQGNLPGPRERRAIHPKNDNICDVVIFFGLDLDLWVQ